MKDNRNPDGAARYCCECRQRERRIYEADHRDEVRAQTNKWREANRDKVLTSKKRYWKAHKEEAQATILQWREAHPDKVKEYYDRYYENNREKIKDLIKKFKDAHREEINEANKIYKQEHPDRYRDYCENRRARIRDQYVDDIKRIAVFERDNGICHICGLVVDKDNWHLDHVIPIAVGGEHSYVNVAVSHPKCNLQKGAGW